ncbi:MAG: M23 family metallopeptidase [Dehalococcoidia bacterium]
MLRPVAINKTLRAEQPISAEQQEVAAQINAFNATPTAIAAASSEDAVVRAAAVAPPPDLPPYQVYEVQEGDTVGSIGERFGISPTYIIANNAEIQDSDFLVLGQSILIPAGDGILHEVRYGETLSDIASRYDVDVEVIVEFHSNGIGSADAITEAQLVYVPGGVPLPAAPPEAEPIPDDAEPIEAPTAVPNDGSSGDGGGSAGEVVTGPPSSSGLIWPFYGNISSYYSGGHPLGIDIDGFNNPNGGVVAATSGTVIFAGGNACCSYGLYVVVMSDDGIETLYAHLASISVSQGESVGQGEVIGTVGSTGYSTGTHLHFEVIDNGVRVNPINYLP